MGTVRIEQAGSWYFDGDMITQSIICVYCDQCGSFRISKRLTLKAIISVAVLVLLIAYAIRNIVDYKARIILGVICLVFLSQFLSIFGVLKSGYRCKKCGNMHITDNNNVLDYPYYDKSILDIPFEDSIQFTADDY